MFVNLLHHVIFHNDPALGTQEGKGELVAGAEDQAVHVDVSAVVQVEAVGARAGFDVGGVGDFWVEGVWKGITFGAEVNFLSH